MQAAVGNQTDLKTNLIGLVEILTETSSVDNCAKVSWPRLPDNPGQGIALKLRASQGKRDRYVSIKGETTQNRSKIAKYRIAVDVATKLSSSKKVGASEAIVSILNATIEAEKNFDDYAKQLSTSILEMNKDIAELEQLITTTTARPTSTYRTLSTTNSLIQNPTTSTTTLPLTTTSTIVTTTTLPVSSTPVTSTTLPITTSTSTSTTTAIPCGKFNDCT